VRRVFQACLLVPRLPPGTALSRGSSSLGNRGGSLGTRKDNDPARDLTPKGIVAALRKLDAAGVPIVNEYVILNYWR